MTSQTTTLPELLHRADIWRGRDALPDAAPPVWHTGFSPLDQALHHGGWPAHGLTELLSPGNHPGLLRLLLPALARVDNGMIILANPPARPNAAALCQAGIDIARLLVIRSSGEARHLLRACLEAAASNSASALVFWAPASFKDPRHLRRLHLAAQQGRCWLTLIREPHFSRQGSPAPLRLHWQPQPTSQHGPLDAVRLTVLKQPGGWAGQQITLPWLPETLRHAKGRAAGLAPPVAQISTRPILETEARAPVAPPEPEPVIYRLGTPVKQLPEHALDLGMAPGVSTGQPDAALSTPAPATPAPAPADSPPVTSPEKARRRRISSSEAS